MDNKVMLIDYGMATEIGKLISDHLKMTPEYRAPEIQLGATYSPAQADVFGLGVCFYQIMVLDNPFVEEGCT
jgi:serine/threonine protein kinase